MAYYRQNESKWQMISRVNLKNRMDHETVTANVKLALEKRKAAENSSGFCPTLCNI